MYRFRCNFSLTESSSLWSTRRYQGCILRPTCLHYMYAVGKAFPFCRCGRIAVQNSLNIFLVTQLLVHLQAMLSGSMGLSLVTVLFCCLAFQNCTHEIYYLFLYYRRPTTGFYLLQAYWACHLGLNTTSSSERTPCSGLEGWFLR